jgi:hypothetical protein
MSRSSTDGSPDTMSLGRPVDPPDVGAFHAGDTDVGEGAVVEVVGRPVPERQAAPVPERALVHADDRRRVGELDDRLELGSRQA